MPSQRATSGAGKIVTSRCEHSVRWRARYWQRSSGASTGHAALPAATTSGPGRTVRSSECRSTSARRSPRSYLTQPDGLRVTERVRKKRSGAFGRPHGSTMPYPSSSALRFRASRPRGGAPDRLPRCHRRRRGRSRPCLSGLSTRAERNGTERVLRPESFGDRAVAAASMSSRLPHALLESNRDSQHQSIDPVRDTSAAV
jgi:hypothetical protein